MSKFIYYGYLMAWAKAFPQTDGGRMPDKTRTDCHDLCHENPW